ncbi:bacteriorhodopsin [Halorientalis brevis]|uniref:Bacteriorhodopsin n=1 Tax=Halorientalis brevis TaxID=1126241 RepID=A0ABD6CFL9_9EURY|nr:bacteriorhodopsin [Halorientalis brevis]
MTNITTWFQLGTVGMILGTLAMAWAMRYVPREKYRESSHLIVVGVIAAVAYALMSVGVGTIKAVDGHTVYLARYIDWLLTTPLHVVYLGLLAEVGRRQLGELAVWQGLTIALGLLGAYLAPPLKWVLFLAGGLAFVRVLQLLYRPIYARVQERRSDSVSELYRKLLNFIAVLWMMYPVIWVLAPSGVGLMDLETQSLVISYIDVVAKVGFGLIALHGQAIAATLAVADDAAAGASVGD